LKIFTLGYQGLSSELYVRSLVNAGVGTVLDVREHAWSQRPEFVKSSLRNALLAAGIEYAHIPTAGNPSKNRKTAKSAAQCLSRYRKHLTQNDACLRGLIFVIEAAAKIGKPACLTCYERSYSDCHRSILMEELLKLEPSLNPIHLEPYIEPKRRKTSVGSSRDRQSPFRTAFLAPAFLPFR
jgi:uncharacterized protein (DUF488 family)